MAKKIKFALEMNGTKIRTMEELQENFDLDAAVQYLLDGKLLTWLEDRFYEDEAEKIAELDKNAPNMKQQLCEILGVECEDDSEMDVDELERLNEKKRILKTMTDDEDIIANADKTALDQEDLSNLLNAGADTIYLCGDNFTVPVRFKNKRYVGILGVPRVKIKAASEDELKEKGIVFENVLTPCVKNLNTTKSAEIAIETHTAYTTHNTLPMEQLKEIFRMVLTTGDQYHKIAINESTAFPIWQIVYKDNSSCYTKFDYNCSESQKSLIINLIGQGKYKNEDLLYIRANKNMQSGIILTKDSICLFNRKYKCILYYDNVYNVNANCLYGSFEYADPKASYDFYDMSHVNDSDKIVYDMYVTRAIATFLNAITNMITPSATSNFGNNQSLKQEATSNSTTSANKLCCTVCGYVSSEANLPSNSVCPICKSPLSQYVDIPIWMQKK